MDVITSMEVELHDLGDVAPDDLECVRVQASGVDTTIFAYEVFVVFPWFELAAVYDTRGRELGRSRIRATEADAEGRPEDPARWHDAARQFLVDAGVARMAIAQARDRLAGGVEEARVPWRPHEPDLSEERLSREMYQQCGALTSAMDRIAYSRRRRVEGLIRTYREAWETFDAMLDRASDQAEDRGATIADVRDVLRGVCGVADLGETLDPGKILGEDGHLTVVSDDAVGACDGVVADDERRFVLSEFDRLVSIAIDEFEGVSRVEMRLARATEEVFARAFHGLGCMILANELATSTDA